MNFNNPYSDLKIFHHTDAIREFLQGNRLAPIYIRIKPTNVCNQKCFYCCYSDDIAVDTRTVNHTNFIPKEKMFEIIDDLNNMGVKAVTFSGGGDPLCYQYIEESIDKVIKNNIDISIITNAQLLKDKKAEKLKDAKWVRVSLDAANTETYYDIRRVRTFPEVIDNIQNFANIKNSDCELGINYVINDKNYNQVYEICKIASDIGVNNIKFSGMMIRENTHSYHEKFESETELLINKAIDDFQNDKFKIINKYIENLNFNRDYKKCYIQNFVTVIAADQKVYTCHQKAYTPSGEIGSIKELSFKELWFSDDTNKKLMEFNPKCECKASCVYDQRNILLNTLKELDTKHINFI